MKQICLALALMITTTCFSQEYNGEAKPKLNQDTAWKNFGKSVIAYANAVYYGSPDTATLLNNVILTHSLVTESYVKNLPAVGCERACRLILWTCIDNGHPAGACIVNYVYCVNNLCGYHLPFPWEGL